MSEIYLFGYDLFKGMIQKLSPVILGKTINGIWHTSLLAFNREWYFGNVGIDNCIPKGTILGEPTEIIFLGKTDLNEEDFLKIIKNLSATDFKRGSYKYLSKNCNNFTNEMSLLLFNKTIPSRFIDLTKEVLNSPLGSFLEPLLNETRDPNFDFDASNRYFKRELKTDGNNDLIEALPNQIMHFKPTMFENDFSRYLEEYKKMPENDSKNVDLIDEIKHLIENQSTQVIIGSFHVDLLIQIFLKEMKNENKTLFLKAFQIMSLNEKIADLIVENAFFWSNYLLEIKNFSSNELKYLAIQQISNLLVNKSIDEKLLDKYQDLLFEELSAYCFVNVTNSQENEMLHEASISLFYNLISAHLLENKVNETNRKNFGRKLFENLVNFKSKPKTIHQILLLLKKCLVN